MFSAPVTRGTEKGRKIRIKPAKIRTFCPLPWANPGPGAKAKIAFLQQTTPSQHAVFVVMEWTLAWTRNPADAHKTFDLLGSKEKELLWIGDTPCRFKDGCNCRPPRSYFFTNWRNSTSSAARAFRKRRCRSALVLRFSCIDFAGRPGRSESGKSAEGVNTFLRLKASGA